MADLVAENGRPEDDRDDGVEALSPEKTRFVEAIAEGKSVADAAMAAERSARTGRRWKAEPEVAAAIRARLTENLAQARAVLASGAARAARSLVDMADGTKAADAPTVSAARAVVESVGRLVELHELEQDLAEVKAMLAAGRPLQ